MTDAPDKTDQQTAGELDLVNEEHQKKIETALEKLMEENQKIGFFFPEGKYSESKKILKKVIKDDLSCDFWTGEGWEGDKCYIDTIFLKTQIKMEREVKFQGDQLWYNGPGTLAAPLIKATVEAGGFVVFPKEK